MINVEDKIRYPKMPNWEKFNDLTKNSSKEIMSVSHTTVRTRLGFAQMHLKILKQAENNEMKRAMSEDVIVNLVSTFEAIGHLLNGFYNIGIEDRIVTIDHKFPNSKRRYLEVSESCLRCRLVKVNPRLADMLDQFLKVSSPVEDWYKALIEYRPQVLHRQHFIARQILWRTEGLLSSGRSQYNDPPRRILRQEIKEYCVA